MTNRREKTRVLFSCTGVGIYNRGIESFFRESFDALKTNDHLDCHLIKGEGAAKSDESVAWNLPRTGKLAAWVGKLARRNAYVVEQWSSFFSVARQIRRLRPQVIFYSDANLGFLLFWRRRQIGVPYKLLFSNGGPVHPPFARTDFVHQVAPCYYGEAIQAGEPGEKHFFVPYGIHVNGPPKMLSLYDQRSLRAKLGISVDRQVVLSVGWISRQHKRMHYVVEETAKLPKPRPFLQLLGAMDANSAEVTTLAQRLLGTDGFSARSVPYEEVAEYYRAADCFVLASLKEGFGRVYLEALMHGLPVVAHKNPVTDFVVGEEGSLENLEVEGALSKSLASILKKPNQQGEMEHRWQNVRNRFDWAGLRPKYQEMFEMCAQRKLAVARQTWS